MSLVLVSQMNEWINIELTTLVFLYFVVYFWIILFQLSYLIFGGFENKQQQQYGGTEAFKRASIAMVLFWTAFFGIAIEMAKETTLPTKNIAIIVISSLITSVILIKYRYVVLTYFGVKKGEGINFLNIRKYIRWYHYGAVIIFLLFNGIVFL